MSVRTASQLRVWLVSYFSTARELDPRRLDVQERFSNHGLDSLGAIRLVGELSRHLGRSLSPTLVWEHPTFAALASYLAGEHGAPVPAAEPEGAHDVEEPIAIVDMACRFPGAPDLGAFWRLLAEGVDATDDIPAERWDAGAYHDEDRAAPGKAVSRRAALLEDVDRFDPQAFGISQRATARSCA